jgi:hypothetical protein
VPFDVLTRRWFEVTQIRVNPASVQAYGRTAQSKFEEVRSELDRLVQACATVHYYGPNAVSFKTQCGQMAADFALQLVQRMGALADSIKTSTSNIAASLGGSPVVIQVNGSAVQVPSVPSVDYVDVDTAALDGLIATVNGHFASIKALFVDHQRALDATDWLGNAKEQTQTNVADFTSKANAAAEASQKSLVDRITAQRDASIQADAA